MINLRKTKLIIWLLRESKILFSQLKFRKLNLKIGYGSTFFNTVFGYNNIIESNVFIGNSVLGDYIKLKNSVSLSNVEIRDFSYVSTNTKISFAKIGKFCSIGPDCKIGLGKHPVKNFVSTHPAFFSKNLNIPITFAKKAYFKEASLINIGHDVWIGSNCIILDGVSIGNGAIVGAGSLLTKDVLPYSVVGGVPAKLIKYRFSETKIQELLDIKWWDNELDFFKNNFKKFHNINYFIQFIKDEKKS